MRIGLLVVRSSKLSKYAHVSAPTPVPLPMIMTGRTNAVPAGAVARTR
jgi:hypothetical protein